MKIEEKLVSLRKTKGLTQMNVAEELDVSRQAVSRWESGAAIPSTENLRVLSELYGVPVDYLLNEKSEKPLLSEGTKTEEREGGNKKLKKRILIFAAALAFVVIVFGALIYRAGEGNHAEDVTVGALDCEKWDNTGAEDFSMDW